MRKSGLLVLLLGIALAFEAAPAGKFELSIDNLMRGHGLYGYEPSEVRWSPDAGRIYTGS